MGWQQLLSPTCLAWGAHVTTTGFVAKFACSTADVQTANVIRTWLHTRAHSSPSLHGEDPNYSSLLGYLVDLCVPVALAEGRQRLHATSSCYLMVPRSRTSLDQRAFVVFGPSTWNSTSVIYEHNITNVSAQTEDASIPTVTVVVLWQHWSTGAAVTLLYYTVSAASNIKVVLSYLLT